MATQGFALFDTAIGTCGIAWGPRGVTGVQLPEARDAETRARVRRRHPAALEASPPPAVQDAIDRISALLAGAAIDLTSVVLDMKGVEPFDARVYDVARTIPAGATLTYGEIAVRLGDPAAAREVGRALARNRFPLVVPCHRVLAAGGKMGGFSAYGGVGMKLKLLSIEHAQVSGALPLFADG